MYSERLSVAPMMKCTDRHFRFFIRLMSRYTCLYTEMIPAGAIVNGQEKRFLLKAPDDNATVAQFGGNCPNALAGCATAAERWGYAGVNLNAGCPSDRVKSGGFGVYLMKQPGTVKPLLNAMQDATSLPVGIKIRTGVDELDSYEYLRDFIGEISLSGCRTVIIHARKAWLNGLNPKQNRTVPPLKYDTVYRIKQDFPDLTVVINGGIRSIEESQKHLLQTDGVMIGRAAYDNPLMFMDVDRDIFGQPPPINDVQTLVEQISAYMKADQREFGTGVRQFARHLLAFFHGCKGAARYRRAISEHLLTRKESTTFFLDFFSSYILPNLPSGKDKTLRAVDYGTESHRQNIISQ